MIYELINPSDKVTFIADDDKIAFMIAIIVGNGAYGCENKDTGESLKTLLLFMDDDACNKLIEDTLESELKAFLESHVKELVAALKSCAYKSASERKMYDAAIAAITDPEKLKEFKEKDEDENRSSMNQIVKSAWNKAEILEKKYADKL